MEALDAYSQAINLNAEICEVWYECMIQFSYSVPEKLQLTMFFCKGIMLARYMIHATKYVMLEMHMRKPYSLVLIVNSFVND